MLRDVLEVCFRGVVRCGITFSGFFLSCASVVDARCAMVVDLSRCVAAPLENVYDMFMTIF